jgi:hypothetical protein
MKKFKKYKSWNPPKSGALLVIVLSSTVNQRAAQNNYYTELDLGVPGFVFPKLFYLYSHIQDIF